VQPTDGTAIAPVKVPRKAPNPESPALKALAEKKAEIDAKISKGPGGSSSMGVALAPKAAPALAQRYTTPGQAPTAAKPAAAAAAKPAAAAAKPAAAAAAAAKVCPTASHSCALTHQARRGRCQACRGGCGRGLGAGATGAAGGARRAHGAHPRARARDDYRREQTMSAPALRFGVIRFYMHCLFAARDHISARFGLRANRRAL